MNIIDKTLFRNKNIKEISERIDINNIGNKGKNIKILNKNKYKIPKTYLLGFEFYEEYKKGNKDILEKIKKELSYIIIANKKYAIRSSANIEDDVDYSYAGQFITHLNIEGINRITNSIISVWESAEISIKNKIQNKSKPIKMAVIIQEMVEADFSGVVFTKNPVDGRNETIIEAVRGLGEKLVQSGVDPIRWVYKWGDFIEAPEEEALDEKILKKIVKESNEIQKIFGYPIDLEWAYDGDLYWLQARKIIANSADNFYSNYISRDVMPGLIKPMVWSINIPVINSSWIKLIKKIIGEFDYTPEQLTRAY